MLPTYVPDKLHFVNRLAYGPAGPDRGDVVAIQMAGPHVLYVKRIVGLPGERVRIAGGQVQINGTASDRALCPPPAGLGRRGSDARAARVLRDRRQSRDVGRGARFRAGRRPTASSVRSSSDAANARHRPHGRRRSPPAPGSCSRPPTPAHLCAHACRRWPTWSTRARSMGWAPRPAARSSAPSSPRTSTSTSVWRRRRFTAARRSSAWRRACSRARRPSRCKFQDVSVTMAR